MAVSIRMSGRVRTSVLENGTTSALSLAAGLPTTVGRSLDRTTEVLSLTASLFDIQPGEAEVGVGPSGDRRCPASLPFLFAIPPVFEDEHGIMNPLPPSYDAHITAAGDKRTAAGGALKVEVEYSISVSVTLRSKKIFTKNKVISTPFVYRPRTRPSNPPPVVDDSVLGALKTAPDLWTSHARELGASSSSASTSALARSEILLPKSGVFCLASAVPLHIQLADPAQSWTLPEPATPCQEVREQLRPRPQQLPTPPSSPPPAPQHLEQSTEPSGSLPRAVRSEINLGATRPAHKRSGSSSSRWWRTLVTPSPSLPLPPTSISPSIPTSTSSPLRRSRRPSTAPAGPSSPSLFRQQQPQRRPSQLRHSLCEPNIVESAAIMPPSSPASTGPRAYLVRRVSVSLGTVRACGAYACGEAQLRRMSGAGITGAWEGEIELDEARLHRVPGFRASGLCVEDFIVVAWGDGVGEHAVPVRLVTDPFPGHDA
ncbi:hypothetical protein EXIGLDRAFT_729113 [Exidia glandulosa HHB12029]|uniref:Uncharacterized protein n=1 Tax=Exidia glandulosa HHB12029 TaxID=1314781 RepID=A0A165CQK1_EXIGL|nr:hypothetical protein EXIGLDRAFT_729113 [Exidia glandulosa HHB12029]